MTVDVTVPELGDGVAEAQFAAWLCAEGGIVREGDEIAEVMTDKVNVAVISPGTGRLTSLAAEVDDMVRVGQVTGLTFGNAGPDWPGVESVLQC